MTIFIVSVLFLLLILAASWFAYSKCFYSPVSRRTTPEDPFELEEFEAVSDHIYRMTHIMEKIPFEEVTVVSHDGLKLYGRYYHVADNAPIELLFHGYKSHALRDCSGGHALSRKMGFNALVVDQRSHGNSEGSAITFGIQERHDVQVWIRYCVQRFGNDVPLILSGISMGAATVLMATDADLPGNVACVIADCPYSSPVDIIEKVCKDEHYPVSLCRPFLHLSARVLGRFRLKESSAAQAVAKAKIPILLIHGEDDKLVPCQMSHEIARANPEQITVVTFPNAGHGLCYMTDPRRYEYVICQFLCRIPAIQTHIRKDYLKQVFEG